MFSNPQQMAFLAGGLANNSTLLDSRTASRLAEKAIFCPMGIDRSELAQGHGNPYPEALRRRPIFLWGGGIWPWMDLEPLLQAFRIHQDEGGEACLFFLSGVPADSSRRLAEPVRKLIERARELDVMGRSVYLNETMVEFGARLGFLEHCTAGILCNPPTLESACSWRTRVLDLVLAGKSAVVAGADPLTTELARHQAIETTSLDATEIAAAIRRLCDPSFACERERKTRSLASSFSWEATMAPLLAWMSRGSLGGEAAAPRWWELAKFVLPF